MQKLVHRLFCALFGHVYQIPEGFEDIKCVNCGFVPLQFDRSDTL
jgi:hypothetical protein